MQLIIIYVVAITFGHFVKEVKTGCTLEPKIDENEDALILQESIRSGEGQISHSARVIIDGGATKLEGERVLFFCETKAESENVTVKWFHEGVPVNEVASRDTTVMISKDGLLFINPVRSNDSGQYSCEIGNSIGEPQTASAYLEVQYPARVTFTPTIQYLPLGSSGVVHCYIQAHPPLQYVTWVKNKRLFEPYQTTDIIILNNGSLLFTTVNENHQGSYTCTPYNHQGTEGSSGPMEVLVRKPPAFTIKPEAIYLVKVGDTVEMHCEAQEGENTQKPTMQWRRSDGNPLPKKRVEIVGGNITIENLTHSDIGSYQCLASNEVEKILASTELVIEGNLLLDPYNLTGTALESAVTLSWVSGSSQQTYRIWYREAGAVDWLTKLVTPSGSTQMRINCLAPGTSYEFQLVGKNVLEDVMLSNIITVRTLSKESLTDDGN